ncbi:sigma-70 family RNA polymerase sigma factor [Ktedonospora formicarum]|uniref:Sigma 28 (Flagella/sporulation) n=1 Tax=Ktedonospora formicarum TaxID=2778364 RepID=A0A8J3I4T1_9CHLR|nr:FliA/WhiG family RNA polymerase sigma factor [Ktedonospora formicarum]GHO44799.1 sigma 28 (flagella/sporulation) [Ktedonospora formicarum]
MQATITLSELWEKYQEHKSPELRIELITMYAPLVRFVVGRLGIPPTSLLDMEDLIGYGTIGLINAIDRYDPARGVRFEAFATPRIRGAVIDQIRQLNWLPRSAVSRIRQIEKTLAELEQTHGRPATEVEAANALDVSVDRYRQMLAEMSVSVLSLDAPLGTHVEEETASLADLLEDEEQQDPGESVEREELTQALSSSVENLPQREQLLLSLYYKEELTMKEISRIMNVSESRVCQLRMQALVRLRSMLNTYETGEAAPSGGKGRGRAEEQSVYVYQNAHKRHPAASGAGKSH